jgi:hypothetical protein
MLNLIALDSGQVKLLATRLAHINRQDLQAVAVLVYHRDQGVLDDLVAVRASGGVKQHGPHHRLLR